MKKYPFSDEQIALMRNAVLENTEAVTLRETVEFYSQYDEAAVVEWAGHAVELPHPSREELFAQLDKLIEAFGADARPNELLYDALAVKAKYHSPWDVLKEFVEDLKTVHGTGFAHELDEDGLDWPDLAITYQKACEALAWKERARYDAEDPVAIKRWIASGEVGEHDDFRSLLETAGRLLDKSCASDIFGDVVFEAEDSTVHVMTVEGVIGEANPDYVKDLEETLAECRAEEEDDEEEEPE